MEECKRQQHVDDDDDDKWVHDSSLDYNGRIPLRLSTGAWKASYFIIATEFSERLSYFAIAVNLMIYLTRVLHQDLKTAAKSVNYWAGVTTMMPLLGGFIADAYLGRFSTVLVSSIIYILGLLLLAMSRLIPELRPRDENNPHQPRKIHQLVFFTAIYMISVGTGGHKPALESFGADQFDDNHPEERRKKMSFFNWWSFGLCSGLLTGVTVIVYIEDHVSWAAADVILVAVMACTTAVFYGGRVFYRFRKPVGSPLTPMLQVLVAAFRKRNLAPPPQAEQLYEVSKFGGGGGGGGRGRLLFHTEKFKFLDKAAIIEDSENTSLHNRKPWRLSTVTEVEELKLILNMIPVWLTVLPFGICVAQTSTFFVKQSTTLDRRIANGFLIPPASLFGLQALGLLVAVVVYDKLLIPLLRGDKNERGINILQRIGIGMVFSVVTMVVAAFVERKRLRVAEESPVKTMSVFWLAPQFIIIGVGDCFTLVGLQEYFYEQVPDSMRSLGIALYLSVLGASNFASSVLIGLVDDVTTKASGRSWFGKDLNSSRLDRFYWLLAAITASNLVVYVCVARRYPYKNVRRSVADATMFSDNSNIPA